MGTAHGLARPWTRMNGEAYIKGADLYEHTTSARVEYQPPASVPRHPTASSTSEMDSRAMSTKMLREVAYETQAQYEAHPDLYIVRRGAPGIHGTRFSIDFTARVGINPFQDTTDTEFIGTPDETSATKMVWVQVASFMAELEDARNFGCKLDVKANFSWEKLFPKMNDQSARLDELFKQLGSNAGEKFYEGEGRIVGPNEVEVTQPDGTKRSYTAKNILIATGSTAERPNIPGKELGITTDEALSLEKLPKKAVVVGDGYLAVEFASIWNAMGVKVDLCFTKELPLSGIDNEMRAVVAKNLQGRGINVHPRTGLKEVVKSEDGIKVITDHGEELLADVVLFATGRSPNTSTLNLEDVGVELENDGFVKVDDYSRTNIPSIWSIGDVTNRLYPTPITLVEGTCFAKTVFGGEPTKPDYKDVPCAVYCIPPLAVVGLSEEQAMEQAKDGVLVFTSSYNPIKNTIFGRQEETVVKLVVDAETDKVLGASMCGPNAPEIIQSIAIALKCGATKSQFDSTELMETLKMPSDAEFMQIGIET